jgi:hypothetical protein
MSTPTRSELSFYTNKPLNAQDWSTNFLKIIEWLTSGNYDFTIQDLTCRAITASGNITSSGTITGNAFSGDGSALTGIQTQQKNYLINSLGQVDTNNTDYTLVKDTYGTRANEYDGMATGTAVTAGVLTVTDAANIGRTLRAIKFSGVTLTGSGVIYLRTRLLSTDAKKLKSQVLSYQALVYHDVGSAINYVVYFRKADSLDDFSSVTEISNSGNISVSSATSTQITYENVSVGDCSNGLEVEVVVTTGAITTKNFEFTEMQLEIGTAATDYEYKQYNDEINLSNALENDVAFLSAVTRYYTIVPADFTSILDTGDWQISVDNIGNRTIITAGVYRSGIHLPHGAIVTSVNMYGYSNHASASIVTDLKRTDFATRTTSDMATCTISGTPGETNNEDTSISNATIDNSAYGYQLEATVDPGAAVGDALLRFVIITFTVAAPLP